MNIKALPNTAVHRSFSGAGRPDLHPGQEVCHVSGAESTVSHPAKMIGKMIGWFLRANRRDPLPSSFRKKTSRLI